MAVDRRARARHWLGTNRSRWTAVVCAVALGISCSRSADAQSLSGNVFAGAGVFKCCEGHTGAWQVGGGVDIPVVAGVSVSGDFGLVGPTGDGIVRERSGYASFGNGRLLSFNASYRFNRHDAHQPWPFLTGGTGVMFGRRDAIVGGLNVGGGIDWWLRERRGVRVEVRDQLLEEFDGSHLVTLRVGFIFR
jgi:hypothetical protein